MKSPLAPLYKGGSSWDRLTFNLSSSPFVKGGLRGILQYVIKLFLLIPVWPG